MRRNTAQIQGLRERWCREVYDRAAEIDPDDELFWRQLLLGFLIGAGVPLGQAREISQREGHGMWPC